MIKKLLSSQLRLNMTSGVLTTVMNTLVMAAGYPIYLHFLGYEKYGVYLILATVFTFAQLGNLGIGQAVMKLVAEEYGRNNIEGLKRPWCKNDPTSFSLTKTNLHRSVFNKE